MPIRPQLTALILSLILVACSNNSNSPPSTPLGKSPEFDALLAKANENWSFLFANDFQIAITDIYGKDGTVIFDLRNRTNNQNSKFLGCESISPNGRFLLTAYYYERTDDENQIDDKMILIDLQDYSFKHVPIEHEDFAVEWIHNTHWLNDNTFLVPIKKFQQQRTRIIRKYIQKQLRDLSATKVIAFPTDDPVQICHPESSSLLFASEKELTSWTVHAYDINGFRLATDSETDYFNIKYRNSSFDPLCPVEAKIEPVTGTMSNKKGHLDRYWILFNGEIVRRADVEIEIDPVWDAEIELLIWYEITLPYNSPYQTFYMDADRHYREWHDGEYWGKIPKVGK